MIKIALSINMTTLIIGENATTEAFAKE